MYEDSDGERFGSVDGVGCEDVEVHAIFRSGYPLLLTLPIKLTVTIRQIRARLWQLVRPLLKDESLEASDELPFHLWAQWGY